MTPVLPGVVVPVIVTAEALEDVTSPAVTVEDGKIPGVAPYALGNVKDAVAPIQALRVAIVFFSCAPKPPKGVTNTTVPDVAQFRDVVPG